MRKAKFFGLFVVLISIALIKPSLAKEPAGVSVFVSIPPQSYFARQISGKDVDVHVMVGPGKSPHTFEPTPKRWVSSMIPKSRKNAST